MKGLGPEFFSSKLHGLFPSTGWSSEALTSWEGRALIFISPQDHVAGVGRLATPEHIEAQARAAKEKTALLVLHSALPATPGGGMEYLCVKDTWNIYM